MKNLFGDEIAVSPETPQRVPDWKCNACGRPVYAWGVELEKEGVKVRYRKCRHCKNIQRYVEILDEDDVFQKLFLDFSQEEGGRS